MALSLEPYDSFAYNFELKKAGNLEEQMSTGKIVQSTGKLVLFTGRNDLMVTLEGVDYTPPATIPDMASGKYKATLSGGVTKIISITVEEGGRTVVDLDELL